MLALVALALLCSSASAADYASTARNVIPSGQYGGLPIVPAADDQAQMYDGLTPLFNRVGPGDLLKYFKSEALGAAGQGPLTNDPVPGRTGIKITRDNFNVPHIEGATNDDVTFATGWVVAKDRGLLLEQARYNSRVAAVDAPGLSALGLISSLRNFTPTAQAERELAKQTGALQRAGAKGRAVLHDIDVYVAGINTYYRANNNPAKPWNRNNIYAVNALRASSSARAAAER